MSHKVVLATVGSLGDLHPFMALSLALRDRGLRVVLACAVEYQSKVAAAGIEFQLLRPGFDEIERDLGMNRAQLTRAAIDSSWFLFRRLVFPYLRAGYEDMMSATADADLVVTSSLAFSARLAAEKRGIPWIAVVLQPMMFLSAYDPPVIPQAGWVTAILRRLGPRPTRCAIHLLKAAVSVVFRPLRVLRTELGLAPASRNPLFDGQFGNAGAIGLYSPLLGSVRPDYPRPATIVGFAHFDSEDGHGVMLDPALEAFLRAEPPPLVFTLGSLIVNSPGEFYEESVRVSRNVKRRAVLLVGEGMMASVKVLCAVDIFICAYAPHSLLFPRAAAIIHQGGIGTLAQALRAGRPQLIVPFFADQLDNADRAARLGVARISSPRRYARSSGTQDLKRLLGGGYAERAREVGSSLADEDGAAAAARIVLDTLEQLERK